MDIDVFFLQEVFLFSLKKKAKKMHAIFKAISQQIFLQNERS